MVPWMHALGLGPQGSWPVEHFWSKLWECTTKFPSDYDVSSLQVPNYFDYDLIITDSNIYPNMCSTFLVPGPSPLVAGWSSYLAPWSLGTERLGTEVFHIGSTWLHIDQILSKQHPPFFGRTMGAPELKKNGGWCYFFPHVFLQVANDFWAEFLPRATIACTSGIYRAKKGGHMRSLSLARGSQVIRCGKPRKGYVWTPRCAWFVQVHKKFNKPGWNSWISPTLHTHTHTNPEGLPRTKSAWCLSLTTLRYEYWKQ